MTFRAVHAEQKTITTFESRRIDPERGVLPVSDESQLRIRQGIRLQGLHGQVAHACSLLAL